MRSLLAGLMITTLWMLVSCERQPNPNEAKAALMQIATKQEQFYLSNETYTNDMTELDFATDPFVTKSGLYTIDIVPGADRNNYSATATYSGADAEAHECLRFGIDGYGTKTSGPNPDCWTR